MLDLRDKSAPTYQVTDKSCLSMHYGSLLLGHTPFEVNFLDNKGRANAEDILRDYGNSATTIRYVTGQRGATFVPDAEGNALEIGVHSLHPSLQPVYHEQVHEWLTLFGGSDPERFLDWLAVATLTRFPVCAMYIHGLPGSGKSMLLQGLAAMWGGAPVPFAAVAADFNAGLLDSPSSLRTRAYRRTKATSPRLSATSSQTPSTTFASSTKPTPRCMGACGCSSPRTS